MARSGLDISMLKVLSFFTVNPIPSGRKPLRRNSTGLLQLWALNHLGSVVFSFAKRYKVSLPNLI
jgi:hypothetical protein